VTYQTVTLPLIFSKLWRSFSTQIQTVFQKTVKIFSDFFATFYLGNTKLPNFGIWQEILDRLPYFPIFLKAVKQDG